MPFGSARKRRSRTTYRPTVTPEGSTHVDTFTGTTSSVSRTASGKVAVVAVVRQRVFAGLWRDRGAAKTTPRSAAGAAGRTGCRRPATYLRTSATSPANHPRTPPLTSGSDSHYPRRSVADEPGATTTYKRRTKLPSSCRANGVQRRQHRPLALLYPSHGGRDTRLGVGSAKPHGRPVQRDTACPSSSTGATPDNRSSSSNRRTHTAACSDVLAAGPRR